jgi:hypothetical protein
MAFTERPQDAVENLGYDFNDFEIDHFIRHVERLKRREIILVPMALELGLYALWIPQNTAHYIFFNSQAHAIQQTHSILHELAHIVLNHSRKPIDQVLPAALMAQLQTPTPQGRLRKVDPLLREDSEEREAEAFVFIIQKHLLTARRIDELTGQTSSIEGLRRWVDSMAFTD